MLASITKGFELLNELFEDYKVASGRGDYAFDEDQEMMHFGRGGGLDEEMLMRIGKKGGKAKFFAWLLIGLIIISQLTFINICLFV